MQHVPEAELGGCYVGFFPNFPINNGSLGTKK